MNLALAKNETGRAVSDSFAVARDRLPGTGVVAEARSAAFEAYERAIDAHVKNIRRKIEPDPRAPRYLQTVYGVGYRFAEIDA